MRHSFAKNIFTHTNKLIKRSTI